MTSLPTESNVVMSDGLSRGNASAATYVFAGVCLAAALAVIGAVPGFMSPSYGQAIWALGFAHSLANDLSIYAHQIGYPKPAAIAFGLPAIITTSAFLNMGLSDADAYSASFALWILLAFWGAYRIARLVGVNRISSLAAALLWFLAPVIWMHSAFSMVVLGFSLVPFYVSAAWPFIWDRHLRIIDFLLLLFASIVAAFMDGYSFVMFATGSGIIWIFFSFFHLRSWRNRIFRLLALLSAVLVAFVLYKLYARSGSDGNPPTQPLEFFRAWGSNFEFFVLPYAGTNLIADTFSFGRDNSSYFGDASAFTTEYILPTLLLGATAVFLGRGDRRAAWAFVAVGLFGIYMSLGPSLKWFVEKPASVATPLMAVEFAPYPTGNALLSKYIPGFTEMRAAYRWVVLGLFGFWAAFLASIAHKSAYAWFYGFVGIIVAGVLYLPPTGRFNANKSSRYLISSVGKDIPRYSSVFVKGERVLFAPVVNDFFVTYLAPKMGITTYNIGGDKNMIAAQSQWPDELKWFIGKTIDHPEMKNRISIALLSKKVDVVGLSFFNSVAPVNAWPVPDDLKVMAISLAEKIKADGRFLVNVNDHYAAIRLANGCLCSSDKNCPLNVPSNGLELGQVGISSGSFEGRGWSTLEPTHIWSTNESATLLVACKDAASIKFSFHPYSRVSVDVEISINGGPSVKRHYPAGTKLVSEVVPTGGASTCEVAFRVSPLSSPSDYGGIDTRRLGIALRKIELVKW